MKYKNLLQIFFLYLREVLAREILKPNSIAPYAPIEFSQIAGTDNNTQKQRELNEPQFRVETAINLLPSHLYQCEILIITEVFLDRHIFPLLAIVLQNYLNSLFEKPIKKDSLIAVGCHVHSLGCGFPICTTLQFHVMVQIHVFIKYLRETEHIFAVHLIRRVKLQFVDEIIESMSIRDLEVRHRFLFIIIINSICVCWLLFTFLICISINTTAGFYILFILT